MEQPALTRLLFLNQWFDPEPCMKGLPFTEALVDRGVDVTVVTGTPNYPAGVVYPGHRNRWHTVGKQGRTTVHQVALYPSHDGNAVKRMLNYSSFFLSGLWRMLRLARSADVLYAYHPPLTVPFATVLVGKVMRRPVVVEIQDLWPESLAATGMANYRVILRVVGAMARFVYRHSDVVIAQSEGFRTAIIERGADPGCVVVIYNWAHESVLADSDELPVLQLAASGAPDEVHVLYAGNLGPAQDLDLLLDAAATLQTAGDRIRIHLMGTGQSEQQLRGRVAAEGLANVTFHPQQKRDVVAPVLAQADALLVILKDDPLFRITVPSKTQSSLAAGRPILMAVAGEAAALVEESGGGVVVPPGDVAALVSGIRQIAAMPHTKRDAMGAAGRAYYLSRLSLAAGADATVHAVGQAIRDPKRRSG